MEKFTDITIAVRVIENGNVVAVAGNGSKVRFDKNCTIKEFFDSVIPKEKNDHSSAVSFSEFWDLYDKKTGKFKCEKKWNKLNSTDRKLIMEYIPEYIKANPNKQYRKHPETFLNNRSWEDEIIYPESNQVASRLNNTAKKYDSF